MRKINKSIVGRKRQVLLSNKDLSIVGKGERWAVEEEKVGAETEVLSMVHRPSLRE